MRNKQEVEAEIKALEACKSYIPSYSMFGDNNHRKVDLQIEYLRGEIDTTAEEFDEFKEPEQSAIFEAQSWKDGDEDESPSSGWNNFKPKPKAKKK